MKTQTILFSAFFTLWLSTGFSQIEPQFNQEQYHVNNSLTAMNSVLEQPIKTDSFINSAAPGITTFPEFLGTSEYSDVNTYIYSKLEFPEEARITGRSGLVKVQFDIYQNGTIGNIGFIESPDSSFNIEVLRLLREMPKWKPALSGASPVKSRYQLNINFSLR